MVVLSEDILTIVGSDDGQQYWTVTGEVADGQIAVNFAPKGGPILSAVYKEGMITWADGNQWSKDNLDEL